MSEQSDVSSGFLCVLLGSDGSGKTSLYNAIRHQRPEWKYISAQPDELYPMSGLEYMNWALETHPRSYVKKLKPLTRSLFFMKTLAIEYEYHIKPALQGGRIVVCDSYFYRFLAKEMIQNTEGSKLFTHLRKFFPLPNLTLWMEVPAMVAYKRAQPLSSFEYGIDSSYSGFSDFQNQVQNLVREMVTGVPMHELDGARSVEANCELVVEIIESANSADK